MNAEQRKRYFGEHWPAACKAQGWRKTDDARRRAATLEATGRDSTTGLAEHHISALFLYLRHLADPANSELAREWITCKADPEKYNRLKQAEYWRKRSGYRHGGKLDRERFGMHFDEEASAEHMTADEVDKYLMTQRSRAKGFKQRRKPKKTQPTPDQSTPTTTRRWTANVEPANCPF